MARFERFTFLCDVDERQAIAALADRLQRSQSDAVRFLVREKIRELHGLPIEKFQSEMEKLLVILTPTERDELLAAIKAEQARRKISEVQNGSQS